MTTTMRLVRERGLVLAHSTNDRHVIAGAGTLGAEICEQAPDLDSLVVAVGGGSQAVGALVAARTLRPNVSVFGVQATGASAIHDSWHARTRLTVLNTSWIRSWLTVAFETVSAIFESSRMGLYILPR